MFEPGWEWVKGGKLPGFGPNKHTTGCDDIEPSGWSARLMWSGSERLRTYTYHQDRQSPCGDVTNADPNIAVGQYHAISIFLRINSAPTSADGILSLYIDGVRRVHLPTIRWRQDISRASEITKFMFSTFYGGADRSYSPSKITHARFDNFAIYSGLRVRTSPGQ
jgi:hypothetical protein